MKEIPGTIPSIEENRLRITELQQEYKGLLLRIDAISHELSDLWKIDRKLSMKQMEGGKPLTPGK